MNAAAARTGRYRAIERLQPGYWWLGTYQNTDGNLEQRWSHVNLLLTTEQITTGQRVVHLRGTDTTGNPRWLVRSHGSAVASMTGRQARKCGLAR